MRDVLRTSFSDLSLICVINDEFLDADPLEERRARSGLSLERSKVLRHYPVADARRPPLASAAGGAILSFSYASSARGADL